MAQTKVIAVLSAALLFISCSAAFAQDYPQISWQRHAIDGHRTAGQTKIRGTAAKERSLLKFYAPQMASLNTVVGYAPEAMLKEYPQSTLSNWVSDILLEVSPEYFGTMADMCIHNFGGIRVDMPKGDVIENDIRSMFPFNNKYTKVVLSGKRLKEIMAAMAMNQFECFAGARVVADRGYVCSFEIGGQPVQDDRKYSVVTNDFLLYGGDSVFLGEGAESVTMSDATFYDVIMAYLRKLKAEGKPIQGVVDDRITIIRPKPVVKKVMRDPSLVTFPNTPVEHPRLTILHTNDTHSHLDPIRAGEYAGWSGVVERAALVDSVRRADGADNVLLLDAGDFSQGTPYFSLFKGVAEIRAMNIMKYDASTLGNHEWDNGPDALAWRLAMKKSPTVLCNYELQGMKLQQLVKPYTILKRGGLKIGLIGILTDVTTSVDKKVADQLKYLDPVEPVNRYADYLKNVEKCDYVIVLSHAGFSSKPGESIGDIQLVPHTRNVDIVIGGHTHTDLRTAYWESDLDGKKVMILSSYKWGLYVGEIKL